MLRARRIELSIGAALLILAGCNDASSEKAVIPAPRGHLVELAAAAPGRLSYTADRAGSLRAVREVRLFNQEDGEITAVTVREGDRVKPGQALVRYDHRILSAELDKAVATEQQAALNHRRNRQLIEKGFIGADALSRTETALEVARAEVRLLRARLQNMTIAAPFAGVISARLVEAGSVTPRHTHLLTLLDPSLLVTDVSVSELVLPNLKVGDPAGVRIDALGDTLHAGRVLRIHPAIDPATRAGMVEVALAPVPEGARPGQFCRVEFRTGGSAQVLVPLIALRRDDQGEFVYVYQDDSTVRRASVTSGLRLADRVEIRSGIASGARVVTKGFIGLSPGQKVKPVEPKPG
jgi:membrane fusion protein (multidrug efflux system)